MSAADTATSGSAQSLGVEAPPAAALRDPR